MQLKFLAQLKRLKFKVTEKSILKSKNLNS